MIIRKAKIKDLDQIVKLALDFAKYHHKFDPYFAYKSDISKIYRENFIKSIYSTKRLLLVAQDNNRLVGYCLGSLATRSPIFKIYDIGVINDAFIDQDYRRKGLLELFLKEMFKWFKSKKIHDVELFVVAKNEIGKNAWAKYGFEDILLRRKIRI